MNKLVLLPPTLEESLEEVKEKTAKDETEMLYVQMSQRVYASAGQDVKIRGLSRATLRVAEAIQILATYQMVFEAGTVDELLMKLNKEVLALEESVGKS